MTDTTYKMERIIKTLENKDLPDDDAQRVIRRYVQKTHCSKDYDQMMTLKRLTVEYGNIKAYRYICRIMPACEGNDDIETIKNMNSKMKKRWGQKRRDMAEEMREKSPFPFPYWFARS